MRKVSLNFKIVDLEGNEINDANKLVAQILCSETDGDIFKYYDWAVTLHKGTPIMVDNTDFSRIKDLIKDSKRLMILAKAQIIKYLDSLKEEPIVK